MLANATTWMNLVDFKLSDRSQVQRDKHVLTALTGGDLEQPDSEMQKGQRCLPGAGGGGDGS